MTNEVVRQTRENKLPASIKLVGGSAVGFKTSYSDIKQREEAVVADKAKAANYESMKELAMRDSLTGLYTRRAFADQYERVTSKILRHAENKVESASNDATLLLVDLDHFKSINDTYGHETGDKVLGEVSSIIKTETRRSDVPSRLAEEDPNHAVGRWGGEEIAILLEETDISGGLIAAEKLRSLIADSEVLGSEGRTITASIGVVAVDPWVSLEGNIANADIALYFAKHNGRNQVVRFDDSLLEKPGV